jgi:hypothetical protein
MKKILFLLSIACCGNAVFAQPTNEPTELGPLNGENENFERARDQLFGNWDWVQRSRGGATAERPNYSEKYRISFDRSGKVTISLNGKVINGSNYSLMEDDARLVFSNWDSPTAFKIDEGPFDFDNNILWLRGEYNDKGSTWQLVKAGTTVYTPPPPSSASTPTTTSRPAAAPRKSAPAVKKKGRR